MIFGDRTIVDIRQVSARQLEPLLLDETAEFDRELDWDFSPSAELVRKVANAGGLGGAALLADGAVVGYSYGVVEEQKGLIWDVYVRPGWRGGNAEAMLFRVLLDALINTSGVCRVESQLMLMGATSAESLQSEGSVRLFERMLMKLDSDTLPAPGRESTASRFRTELWDDDCLEWAAQVVAAGYAGRYRTLADARRFIANVVAFTGCVTFCQPASYIAFDRVTGKAAGASLASFVAREVGHIAELCVIPDAQGAGLGSELLRRSNAALRSAGAKRISLTVTSANEAAVALYRRCGFREVRRFYAYVWEAS